MNEFNFGKSTNKWHNCNYLVACFVSCWGKHIVMPSMPGDDRQSAVTTLSSFGKHITRSICQTSNNSNSSRTSQYKWTKQCIDKRTGKLNKWTMDTEQSGSQKQQLWPNQIDRNIDGIWRTSSICDSGCGYVCAGVYFNVNVLVVVVVVLFWLMTCHTAVIMQGEPSKTRATE